LNSIKDPRTGEKWIGQVFRREEIYQGPRMSDAPDISFLPGDMRYLPLGNADFTSNRFMVDAFGITGCHRMEGVLIARGGPVQEGLRLTTAKIYDVVPTLLYLMGYSVPDDMDGRVLSEIVSDEYLRFHPVKYSQHVGSEPSDEVTYSEDENAEIRESLKNLGYLG
jgi:predicted AlkP superfamily phosphohydrolase/phosphomutase